MEPRVALSSSGNSFFTTFFDNLFGKSTNSSSSQPHYTPAQIAQIKAHRLALQEAHQAKVAAFRAAHPHAHA